MSSGPSDKRPQTKPVLTRRALISSVAAGLRPELSGSATDARSDKQDAELLACCDRVREIEAVMAAGDWDSLVRQLSTTPAQSIAGLCAKAEVALSLLPLTAAGGLRKGASPDEALQWSVLQDALRLAHMVFGHVEASAAEPKL